ncbi:MAG: discoidin domain-containing protein [Chloroflexota bacterium]
MLIQRKLLLLSIIIVILQQAVIPLSNLHAQEIPSNTNNRIHLPLITNGQNTSSESLPIFDGDVAEYERQVNDWLNISGSVQRNSLFFFLNWSSPSASSWRSVNCTSSTGQDSDADRISDEQEKCLAEYYHPILYLHEARGKKGWPSSADWFLERAQLFFDEYAMMPVWEEDWQGRYIDHYRPVRCKQTLLLNNASDFAALSNKDYYWSKCPTGGKDWRHYNSGIQTKRTYPGGWFATYPSEQAHYGISPNKNGDWTPPPMYTHVYPNIFGGVNIQYWYFFPYNGTQLWHEGDWEHINMILSRNLDPIGITFYFHGEHKFKPASELRFIGQSIGGVHTGSHPQVYIAEESHASYWSDKACEDGGFKLFGIFNGQDECPDSRRQIWSPLPLSPVSENSYGGGLFNLGEHNYEAFEWARYGGLWGGRFGYKGVDGFIASAFTSTTSPPSGPMFKGEHNWLAAAALFMYNHWRTGEIQFHKDNGCSSEIVGKIADGRAQKLKFDRHVDLKNDKARSTALFNIRVGAVIRLYDHGDGATSDDWTEIIVKRKIPYYCVSSFERSYRDDHVIVTHHRRNGLDGNVSYVTVTGNSNLAYAKGAEASSVQANGLGPNNAVDDAIYTRWSSNFTDREWIYVDLKDAYDFNRIRLHWERAYGKQYLIENWDTRSRRWIPIHYEWNGDGGVDEISLNHTYTGRWIRMNGLKRGTGWGYSLYEFSVYHDDTRHLNSVRMLQSDSIVIPNDPLLESLDFSQNPPTDIESQNLPIQGNPLENYERLSSEDDLHFHIFLPVIQD